ncbi:MAG: hypothetical protein AAGD13_06270 [Pseudomonadota bacterium]
MRMRIYVAALYGAAALVASSLAEAMPPIAYDEGLGGQLEAYDATGTVLAEMVRADVDVRIQDGIATVQMRQVFSGLGEAARASTYLMPLGADTDVIAIEVAEGSRIQRLALDGPELPLGTPWMFAQDLNLKGDGPVEVTLIYRQPVAVDGEMHSLALPISVLPPDPDGPMLPGVVGIADDLSDLPEYLCGEALLTTAIPRDRIELTVSIAADHLAEIWSDTHDIDVIAFQGGRIVELALDSEVANRTFVLEYRTTNPAVTVVAQAERSR